MDDESLNAGATEGPKGETFAEEERKRKYIMGSVALAVGLIATLVLFYAFGITSAGIEEETGGSKSKEAAAEQKK